MYASLASSTAPVGDGEKKTGNGIVVYGFADGVLTPQGFLKLPMVKLAAGRQRMYAETDGGTMGVPYPAAIAVVRWSEGAVAGGGESVGLGCADGCGDGEIERTFDL